MMEEKEQKEEQEKMEFKKQFYARPVPETTYVSNSSFYVGVRIRAVGVCRFSI
uniref:Uncharacterized protein n=1 Tax=Panagrolaimus sp. JU765 TaxID=591449 RepID=A0AC34R6J4_9BILA